MSSSVTLGPGVIGKEASEREARQQNNGVGGGAIVLGPGIMKDQAVAVVDPEPEPEAFTLLEAETLLAEDPNQYTRVLAAEMDKRVRPSMRKSIAKAVLKATEGQTLAEPMRATVHTALRQIAGIK